jgi:hypothetical protein
MKLVIRFDGNVFLQSHDANSGYYGVFRPTVSLRMEYERPQQ